MVNPILQKHEEQITLFLWPAVFPILVIIVTLLCISSLWYVYYHILTLVF